jgi:hypothetical protein
MFDDFLRFFGEEPIPGEGPETAEAFVRSLGGRSFGGGMMFAIAEDDLPMWRENLSVAYGAQVEGLEPFAYDWMGNCFADGEGGVYVLELGTAQGFLTQAEVADFLADDVPNKTDDALLAPFWREWLESGGGHPEYNQCVGYKNPPFLGGEAEVSNLEISDLDVYWTVLGQVLAKARG